MFTSAQVLPGVFHITDCMGVNMTLLQGTEKALLIDTGYGLENGKEYAEFLAGKKVQVLLTHGHHDHALGSAHFDRVFLFEEDREVFRLYTGREQRQRVARQAEEKGLTLPEEFETRPMPETVPLMKAPDQESGFERADIPLGGMTALVYHVPGHTTGSAVIYVPERELLLTGDNWNPCTWIWFPESESVITLRENMKRILRLLPAKHVLCSHRPELFGMETVNAFFGFITDDTLKNAEKIPIGEEDDIRELSIPGGMVIRFDAKKAGIR